MDFTICWPLERWGFNFGLFFEKFETNLDREIEQGALFEIRCAPYPAGRGFLLDNPNRKERL